MMLSIQKPLQNDTKTAYEGKMLGKESKLLQRRSSDTVPVLSYQAKHLHRSKL